MTSCGMLMMSGCESIKWLYEILMEDRTPFMLDSYESEWDDLCRDQNKHALELDQLRGANRNLSSQVYVQCGVPAGMR